MKNKGDEFDTRIIWLVTVLAAIGIIIISVIVSLQNRPIQTAPSPAKVAGETAPQTPDQRLLAQPATPKETVPPQEAARPAPMTDEAEEGDDTGAQDDLRLLLNNLAGTLRLASPHDRLSAPDQRYPLTFTCFRENINPPLAWSGAPPATQSFVVFFERREQGQKPFVSWVLFNIDGDTQMLESGIKKQAALPDGRMHGRSDLNNVGYGGPCEKYGAHQYVFRVFALDKTLNLEPGVQKNDLIRAMNGHIIDAAEFPVKHLNRP